MKKLLSIILLVLLSGSVFSQIRLSEQDSIGQTGTPLSGLTTDSYLWIINEGVSSPKTRRISLWQLGEYMRGGYLPRLNSSNFRDEIGMSGITGASGGLITLNPGTNIDASSSKIINLATPTEANDATNKSYVDGLVTGSGSGNVSSSGLTNNQVAVSSGTNTIDGDAGLTWDGTNLGVSGRITGLTDPTSAQDAATKDYVDNDGPLINDGNTGSYTQTKIKIIQIGDWDMDATAQVSIAHGISDVDEIRSVQVSIRQDVSGLLTAIEGLNASSVPGGDFSVNDTNVIINRETSGKYDNTTYDNTSYNRGWIVIIWED